MMTICKQCNRTIPDAAKYCPFCQSKIQPAETSVTVSSTVMTKGQLIDALQYQYRLYATQQHLFDEVARTGARAKSDSERNNAGCLGGAFLFFSVGSFLEAFSRVVNGRQLVEAALPLIPAIVCLVLYLVVKKSAQSADEIKKGQFSAALYELKSYYESMPNNMLPFEYSNPYTIKGLLYIAETYNVRTVKDVINKYDEVKAREYIRWMDDRIAAIERQLLQDLALFAAIEMIRPTHIVIR